MNLPFTQGQFFGVFAAYNAAIGPVPLVFYAAAAAAVILALAGVHWAGRFASGLLACSWAFMGALYHLVFFRPINPAAAVFGVLFLVQAGLFAFAAISGLLDIGPPSGWRGAAGGLLIAYGMLLYPLIGALAGHAYPAAPVFGVAPCPTTIFTFGLILWARRRPPLVLLAVPVLWAVIGTSAAVSLGVPQDLGLPAAAVIALALRAGWPPAPEETA